MCVWCLVRDEQQQPVKPFDLATFSEKKYVCVTLFQIQRNRKLKIKCKPKEKCIKKKWTTHIIRITQRIKAAVKFLFTEKPKNVPQGKLKWSSQLFVKQYNKIYIDHLESIFYHVIIIIIINESIEPRV